MVGTSSISHLTLTNNVNNAWNYLEGELNTSAVTNTFWLKIETNAAAGAPVIIDDLVCIPIQAHISLQTFLPFKGSTSSTDDRGNSVKTTYDYLGRPVSLLDRNRNLIERIEYSLKNSFKAKPLTSFAINTSEHFINTPLIFTPSSTNWICDPALGIQWEVDGVGYPSGQDHVLTHTFITPGLHNIKLIATSLTYGTAEFAQTICVQYKYEGPVTYTVTDASGQPAGLSLDCNSGSRFVNLQLPATPAGCWLDIKWTRNGQPYATGGVLQVIGYSPSNTNVIDEYVATITLDCSAYKECNSANIVAYNGTVSVSVTNNQNPNCQ
jgi:YD repeat-containing protein